MMKPALFFLSSVLSVACAQDPKGLLAESREPSTNTSTNTPAPAPARVPTETALAQPHDDVVKTVVQLEARVEAIAVRQQETQESAEDLLELVRSAFPELAKQQDDGELLDVMDGVDTGVTLCPCADGISLCLCEVVIPAPLQKEPTFR